MSEAKPNRADLVKGTSLWKDAFRRLLRNRAAVGGGLIVLFMAILVLQASIVLPRLEIGDKEVGVPVRILSRAVVVLALGACTVSGALCAVGCVLQGVW